MKHGTTFASMKRCKMRYICSFILILLSIFSPGRSFQPHYNVRRAVVGNPLQPKTSRKPGLSYYTPPKVSQHDTPKIHTSNLFRSTSFDPEERARPGNLLRTVVETIQNYAKRCKNVVKRGLLIAMMYFTICSPISPISNSPAWAAGPAGVRTRTGGQMRGSFKPSSRPPSRSYSSSPSRSYASPPSYQYRPSPRLIIAPRPRRHIHVYGNPAGDTVVLGQQRSFATPVRRGPSFSDLVLFTGTGALVTYGVMKNLRDRDDDYDDPSQSPLGPGVSVLSLTVALRVPDRFDETSVLSRLKGMAQRTRSDSRKSVQKLVSDAALEILRQDRAIISVGSEYKHFKSFNDAERLFNTMSMQKRSKFDRETFNNADGQQSSTGKSFSEDGSTSTTAVIDLSVCIEGDSTRIPTAIKTRNELRNALYKISADAQVEECLLSAEVLWTPDDGADTMTEQDVFADYPSLFPLYD